MLSIWWWGSSIRAHLASVTTKISAQSDFLCSLCIKIWRSNLAATTESSNDHGKSDEAWISCWRQHPSPWQSLSIRSDAGHGPFIKRALRLLYSPHRSENREVCFASQTCFYSAEPRRGLLRAQQARWVLLCLSTFNWNIWSFHILQGLQQLSSLSECQYITSELQC